MKKFCPRPFEAFEVAANGAVHACCSGWLPRQIGSLLKAPPMEIFNGAFAQKIRLTILDGTFSYCARSCPFWADTSGPVKMVEEIDPQYQPVMPKISYMNLAFDRTCNLACPSCRSKHYVADEKAREVIAEIQAAALPEDVLENLDWLSVSGSGEVFVSGPHRELLARLSPQRYPNLKVRIHSNGLLFSPTNLEGLGPVKDMIRSVEISIDAATEKTYDVVRGGSWSRLMTNLDFISSLRKEQRLEWFQIAFVVQKTNWREMDDFVRLGIHLGVDQVLFLPIRDWAALPVYQDHAVHLQQHSDRPAYEAYVRESELLKHPIVVLGGF